jgi:hypothetical protein
LCGAAGSGIGDQPHAASKGVDFIGAGDVSFCDSDGDVLTGKILDRFPGTIFLLGDASNNTGRPEEYTNCFDPAWGRFKPRLKPAIGNHDYINDNGKSYFEYFGALAGDAGKGYYSYDLGGWHIIVLNSQCGAGSPEEKWLRKDLADHPAQCTLAYWHAPPFSSGWEADENPQPEQGIREFIVGTGGVWTDPANTPPLVNSQVIFTDTFGVLKMQLNPGWYTWQFIPVPGKPRSDWGSDTCRYKTDVEN